MRDSNPKKLSAKVLKRNLIEFGYNQYKLLDPDTNHVTWARDVEVFENVTFETPKNRSAIIKEEIDTSEDAPNLVNQLSAFYSQSDPVTFQEAKSSLNSANWHAAMEKEIFDLNA